MITTEAVPVPLPRQPVVADQHPLTTTLPMPCLAASAPCPNRPDQAEQSQRGAGTRSPEATLGPPRCPTPGPRPDQH